MIMAEYKYLLAETRLMIREEELFELNQCCFRILESESIL